VTEKLQKVLARAGLGARREIETWIAQGRVTVNGVAAELGCRIDLDAIVTVDGRPVTIDQSEQKARVLLYNKPEGEICSRNDPQQRPTVFDHLPRLSVGRWINVGRLDMNTSGLLLFTNDGDLAHQLMHPSSHLEREYAVRVFGEVTEAAIKKLTQGVMLDDGEARFEDVVFSGGKGINRWFHVVIANGRNKIVRRLWESQELVVSRLKRVRFGPIILGSMPKQGKSLELKGESLSKLMKALSQKNDA
jgi:23S rRNA pseudouridine2605 synthase